MLQKPAILIIPDGWGHGKVNKADAIALVQIFFVNSLYNQYPDAALITCGKLAGLPDGQIGNSGVGHLNIGAGRVVNQPLATIQSRNVMICFRPSPSGNAGIKTGRFYGN